MAYKFNEFLAYFVDLTIEVTKKKFIMKKRENRST